MRKLQREDLLSLEQYAQQRGAIRARMMAHRRVRRLAVGAHCTWSFEDRETIRYQVQEMLRSERIFEAAGIEDELATYNPLIPDGHNLKATPGGALSLPRWQPPNHDEKNHVSAG